MTAKTKKKDLDCVALRRAQRKELGKKLKGMSSAEIGTWMTAKPC